MTWWRLLICTTWMLSNVCQHDYHIGMIQRLFFSNEPAKEICIVDEFQRRGTTFQLNIETKDRKPQFFCTNGHGGHLQLYELQHILQIKHTTIAKRSTQGDRSRWR